jgi:hypothetical protein
MPVFLALRSSTFAGEGGKYTLSLTNPYKKSSGVKLEDCHFGLHCQAVLVVAVFSI